MSKYIAPSFRKNAEATAPVPSDFPNLINGGAGSTLAVLRNGTFADKANSWRQQHIDNEQKKVMDTRVAELRKQNAEHSKLNDDLLVRSLPSTYRPKKKETQPVAQVANQSLDDGWTVVTKKAKHIRRDAVDFTEVPEEMELSSDEHETVWD